MFQMSISLLLCILILLTSLSFIMKKNKHSEMKEKMSPFECGFDPSHSLRAPFSLHFFLMTIIFLIFDIEIAVLLPLPISYSSQITTMNITWLLVLWMMLMFGFLFEWKQGAIDWAWMNI